MSRPLFVALAVVSAPVAHADDGLFTAPDKSRHLVMGFGIAAMGDLLAAELTEDRSWRAFAGLALGAGAGLAKEAFDLAGTGDPSAADLAATLVGAAVGAGLVWLLDSAFASR